MKKNVCGMRSREQEKAGKDMRGIGQTDRLSKMKFPTERESGKT